MKTITYCSYTSRTEIIHTFVDYADFINIAMPMYNLIEYSDNYSDTSGSLWQFKRDEIEGDVDLTVDAQHIPNNSSSFKYKSSFITNRNGVKIAVPLKYLSNFWRSLEMPLINCKVELLLKWIENCVLTTAEIGANADATGADGATFEITDAKLYVPVVTLSAEDNVKLTKQLNEGFKRSLYWNEYKMIDNKKVRLLMLMMKNRKENCSIQVIKGLKNCLFLFMITIKFLLILSKTISFQE